MFSVVTNFLWYVVGFLQTYNGAVTAIATVAIGFFTFSLVRVTNRQAALTRDSINLAREEFISSHRPRIMIYGLNLVSAGDDAAGPLKVSFRYVNSGDSLAKVKEFGAKMIDLFKPTMPTGIEFEVEKMDPPIEVKSGRHGFRLTSAFDQEQFLFKSFADSYSLVCVGYIVYSDASGTDRQVGFCRKYDEESHRWLPMNDSEYEYSY